MGIGVLALFLIAALVLNTIVSTVIPVCFMVLMLLVLPAITAYLIGLISIADIIAKYVYGARAGSNKEAVKMLSKPWHFVVFELDIIKCTVPVLLANFCFIPWLNDILIYWKNAKHLVKSANFMDFAYIPYNVALVVSLIFVILGHNKIFINRRKKEK